MKKTLYLMRHGQTIFNVRRKIQGACDSPLTEEGIRQAKVAGQYFKANNITFDFAYSSTSERACDTLELVTDMPYQRERGIKEFNHGTFEGESEDLHPPMDPNVFGYGDYYVKFGGEDSLEAQARVVNALTDIMERDNHQTVLAVSHGGACTMFLIKWLDDISKLVKLSNCCILKFEYENQEFKFIESIDHEFEK